MFSSFDLVFINWLDATSGKTMRTEVNTAFVSFGESIDSNYFQVVGYPSLPRLFNMDSETSASTALDSGLPRPDLSGGWSVNPWRVINDVIASGRDNLGRALNWLLVLAQSGVSIPVSTYSQAAAFIRDFDGGFEDYVRLMQCLTYTSWMRLDGLGELLSLLASIHERLRPQILDALTRGERAPLV